MHPRHIPERDRLCILDDALLSEDAFFAAAILMFGFEAPVCAEEDISQYVQKLHRSRASTTARYATGYGKIGIGNDQVPRD